MFRPPGTTTPSLVTTRIRSDEDMRRSEEESKLQEEAKHLLHRVVPPDMWDVVRVEKHNDTLSPSSLHYLITVHVHVSRSVLEDSLRPRPRIPRAPSIPINPSSGTVDKPKPTLQEDEEDDEKLLDAMPDLSAPTADDEEEDD